MYSSIKEIGIGTCLLSVFAIHAGLGPELPYVNLVGNFGVGELALLGIICLIIKLNVKGVPLDIVTIHVLVLGVIAMLATFLVSLKGEALDVKDGLSIGRFFEACVLILVIRLFVRTDAKLEFLLISFLFGVILQATVAWALWLTSPKFGWLGLPYLSSDVVNPNTLGFYLALFIPVLLGLFFKGTITTRTILSVILFLSIVTLFFTWSKGAWGSALIGSAVLILALSWYTKRLLPLTSLVIVILILGVGFGSEVKQIVDMRWQSSESTNIQRAEMIKGGIAMWRDAPILGHGPGGYARLGSSYGRNESDPHNAYVISALQFGVLGLIVFLSLTFMVWPRLLKKASAKVRTHTIVFEKARVSKSEFYWQSVFLSLWVVIVTQGMVTGLTLTSKAPWFFLGLLVAFSSYRYRPNLPIGKS